MNESNNLEENASDETIRGNSEVDANISVKCTERNEEISEESSNLSNFEKFINWIVENVIKLYENLRSSVSLNNFKKMRSKSNVTEANKTWNPLGFSNPKGYCYLNSVVQVLVSCEDFKRDINNCEWISTEKTNDSIFVEGLFNLIRAIMECNRDKLNKSLKIVQQKITECSFGDDVYKCFMNILTRVNSVIKTNIDSQNRNPGFVYDNFYGQLKFQTVCKSCKDVCNESSQLIKSLPLPVPRSNSSVTLNSCIDLFFNESDVEVDEPMKCKCESRSTKSLKSITKLIRGPKYLFIYLNRGSYTSSTQKNNTHVTCDGLTIEIKTIEDKSIKYKLISVIDHIGSSAGGHYYCKCSFESEEWWLLNDSHVDRLKNKNDIVTKSTIVFLFKITT